MGFRVKSGIVMSKFSLVGPAQVCASSLIALLAIIVYFLDANNVRWRPTLRIILDGANYVNFLGSLAYRLEDVDRVLSKLDYVAVSCLATVLRIFLFHRLQHSVSCEVVLRIVDLSDHA